MRQPQADVQIILVVENLDHSAHAAATLASCEGVSWTEVRDCAAAVERLQSHHVDGVIVLLQAEVLNGLTLLRKFWKGPLLCICDGDDNALRIIESENAFAILPPFSSRQVVHTLRLLTKADSPFADVRDADERVRLNGELRAEHALRESERRLEQAQRMEAVGRLAGGIAHDFNNLLTVIGSYSDLAVRKLENGHAVSRYVEQIRKASESAATLTRQLLAFSRRQVLQPRVIALNEIVDEISFMVQSLLGARIELRMRLDSQLGQIEADPVQLQQVLLNLIVNAKDAMPDGGLLSIETRNFALDPRYAQQYHPLQPGAYVRLTVGDTGIGMDEETLARIYEPFFTTKPKGHGTGLGLPTVYGIVQQSGGHISVYSEVGKGTTFHIYLPRVDKALEAERGEEEASNVLMGSETILLVEDEDGVRDLASMILQEAGYRLLAAGTPEEAMAIERSHVGNIDLLLTDVIMPRMTGRDVALQLARHRPETPVVYMSGYTEDVRAFQQLVETGAYLVEKPFYPNDLLRMVRRAIEQPIGHELVAAQGIL